MADAFFGCVFRYSHLCLNFVHPVEELSRVFVCLFFLTVVVLVSGPQTVTPPLSG